MMLYRKFRDQLPVGQVTGTLHAMSACACSFAIAENPASIVSRYPTCERCRGDDDPLSGLIADFEGAALEVYRIHPPIHRLNSGSRPKNSPSGWRTDYIN